MEGVGDAETIENGKRGDEGRRSDDEPKATA